MLAKPLAVVIVLCVSIIFTKNLLADEVEEPSSARTELGILPAIAYDSDLGLGLGALAVIARLSEDSNPFDWRMQLVAYVTTKTDSDGVEFPFHNHSITIDIPGFLSPKLRVRGDIAYRQFTNAGYYGFGNRTQRMTEDDGVSKRFHQYQRTYPGVGLLARWQLYDEPLSVGKRRLELVGGTNLTYNTFNIYERSELALDLVAAKGNGEDGAVFREFLRGVNDHILWDLMAGLLWDTRDHEFAPSRGVLMDLSLRLSPGVQDELLYAGITLSSAHFFALYGEKLVLASRVVGDLLVGDVPFYELTNFGGVNRFVGVGGSRSVRSVLRQRYGGKVKLIVNTDLRGQILRIKVFEQHLTLGGVLFLDGGRVWADTSPRRLKGRALDGEFFDFAIGLGGGLRFQWGETFIIRADYGYSPTEDTNGFYIDIGQAF